MDENKELKTELPCERCLHKNICVAQEAFDEAQENIIPTHPFMRIEIKCSQFINQSEYKGETRE